MRGEDEKCVEKRQSVKDPQGFEQDAEPRPDVCRDHDQDEEADQERAPQDMKSQLGIARGEAQQAKQGAGVEPWDAMNLNAVGIGSGQLPWGD